MTSPRRSAGSMRMMPWRRRNPGELLGLGIPRSSQPRTASAASPPTSMPCRRGPRPDGCVAGRRDERRAGAPSAAGASAGRRPVLRLTARPTGARCRRRAGGSSSIRRPGSGRPHDQAARRPYSWNPAPGDALRARRVLMRASDRGVHCGCKSCTYDGSVTHRRATSHPSDGRDSAVFRTSIRAGWALARGQWKRRFFSSLVKRSPRPTRKPLLNRGFHGGDGGI